MKNLLIKYQAIIAFLLGIAATLALSTASQTDDAVVKGLQDSFNQFVKENVVVVNTSPTTL